MSCRIGGNYMEMLAKITGDATNLVEVEITTDDYVVQRKTVSYNDFVASLSASSVRSEDYITLGAMPQGYYSGKISAANEYNFECVVIVPEGNRCLMYYETAMIIPFPEIVFKFTVIQGNLTMSYCFAHIQGDDNLYRYPFGNVYPDGKICWGRTKIPAIDRLCDLDKVVELFFGSKTNDDLFSPGDNVKKNERTITQRGLVTSLNSSTEEFPKELLVQSKMLLSMLAN